MIEYAFKFCCCSAMLYGFYHFALRNDTFFQRNRVYLLLALIISLLFPLVKFSFEPASSGTISYQVLEAIHLGGAQAELAFVLFVWNLEWYDVLWFGVSLWVGIRALMGIWKLIRLSNQLKKEKHEDYIMVFTEGKLPTFSFLNYLFWDNSLQMDETSKASVKAHELIHIRQKHSVDLLFVQVLKVCFWFNPFLYFYAKALKEQHEFIVDATVTKNIALKDYQHALVSVLFKNLNPGFVSSFNQSEIKKRIKKMNQLKTPRTQLLKVLWLIPLMLGLTLAFSTEKVMAQSASDKVYETADQMASPKGGMEALVKAIQKNLKYPKEAKKAGVKGKVFVSFIVNKNGTISDVAVKKGLGHGCDEAAIQAVNNLGLTWIPAQQDGKAVRQRLALPIAFDL